MVCMILLWLGVGNVLSVVLPSRDEPIRQAKAVRQPQAVHHRVRGRVLHRLPGQRMLVWRIFAAQELAKRLGSALLPAIIIIVSSAFMWILLTIVAAALAQQPKVRR